jgi:hypothetical protein
MKCPECGSWASAHYPVDGGPEPPRWACYVCEWYGDIEPEG